MNTFINIHIYIWIHINIYIYIYSYMYMNIGVAVSGLVSGYSGLSVGMMYYATTAGDLITDGSYYGREGA
jgi:hypothetical protein